MDESWIALNPDCLPWLVNCKTVKAYILLRYLEPLNQWFLTQSCDDIFFTELSESLNLLHNHMEIASRTNEVAKEQKSEDIVVPITTLISPLRAVTTTNILKTSDPNVPRRLLPWKLSPHLTKPHCSILSVISSDTAAVDHCQTVTASLNDERSKAFFSKLQLCQKPC